MIFRLSAFDEREKEGKKKTQQLGKEDRKQEQGRGREWGWGEKGRTGKCTSPHYFVMDELAVQRECDELKNCHRSFAAK